MKNLFKYPSTPHLPVSRGVASDDIVLKNTVKMHGLDVVITEKMDGESCSMYRDHIHARSLDSRARPDQDWVRRFWANRKMNIPEGWRICGENLWATHSIFYNNLPSFFLGFSVWDQNNTRLSWEETLEWFELLDIIPVKVLYEGPYSDNVIDNLIRSMDPQTSEGFVVSNKKSFHYNDFHDNMGKYVRPNHVQTGDHWLKGEIKSNKLGPNGQTE